jgi:hypothetical protein
MSSRDVVMGLNGYVMRMIVKMWLMNVMYVVAVIIPDVGIVTEIMYNVVMIVAVGENQMLSVVVVVG